MKQIGKISALLAAMVILCHALFPHVHEKQFTPTQAVIHCPENYASHRILFDFKFLIAEMDVGEKHFEVHSETHNFKRSSFDDQDTEILIPYAYLNGRYAVNEVGTIPFLKKKISCFSDKLQLRGPPVV